jgi:hypothetical protein
MGGVDVASLLFYSKSVGKFLQKISSLMAEPPFFSKVLDILCIGDILFVGGVDGRRWTYESQISSSNEQDVPKSTLRHVGGVTHASNIARFRVFLLIKGRERRERWKREREFLNP